MRLWQLSVFALSFMLLVTLTLRAEDKIIELQDLPGGVPPDEVDFLNRKQAARQTLMSERKEREQQLAKVVTDLAAQRERLAQTQPVKVTVDENEIEGKAPRTMEDVLNSVSDKPDSSRRVRDEYEISPDDFKIDIHDRWSINPTDFSFDAPQYITSDICPGSAKRWFGFTFSITNSTSKTRRISPAFVAVTDSMVLNHAVTGFAPERMMADSMHRPLADSNVLRDKEMLRDCVAPLESQVQLANYALDPKDGALKLSPMATFEPGQTRWGAVLWSNFSDKFTELKIVVHGLNNSHRYEEKMRRALVLTFERKDDEFNVHRTELKFKNKRWEYLWMWEQCIVVPLPTDSKDPQIKIQTLKTPAGADKLTWAFPFTITNLTRVSQDWAINTIAFVCNVAVDVGGTKMPIEVGVIDDGRSTIYKAQMLKSLGKEIAPEQAKDRFRFTALNEEGSKTLLQRRKCTLEPGKSIDETWAIFDETDVDWDGVKFQIETALTCSMDKKAAANATWEKVAKTYQPEDKSLLQKNPGIMYDPRRRLTEEEFAQVKEQVVKAISGAVNAMKAKKTVVVDFDCTSGMSTGNYRINRLYRKPGVVEEIWLTEWENWMKNWEAAEPEL
ncbi:MAG: hypothetical protein V1899_07535 [Planctomycetota bacterium]